MNRFLQAIFMTLIAAALGPVATAAPDRPPNFVVFLTDDQGWGDLGCYGHPLIQSPNLDRFARQGMRLTQCYAACSVCSPSRSSILTGRTPYRNGVWRWIPSGSQYHLRASEITIAELLKARGYATCHAGKWHLNGKFNSADQPQPDDHGYDWWLATQNNASPNHMNPTNYVRNRKPAGRIEGPSAVIAANEAAAWLRDRKPVDAPFFITVWTHEPHLPIESAPKFMEPYRQIQDEGIRQHHGNITQLDHAFGQLMKALEESGHAEDTVVFFTSDNGPEGAGTRGRTRGSTGGLRGRKRHTHEGGIRVPGIIRWPGRIKPGTTSDTPVIGSDIFPTICEIVGIALPKDRVIDGASLVPLFAGKPVVRSQPLYWRNHLAPTQYKVGLREGDWKIVGSDDLTRFELYNIKEDWQESRDLARTHADRFDRLRQKLIAHDRAVLADGPDWWKQDKKKPPKGKKGRKPRPAKLLAGEDRTGAFAVVQGAVVTKGDLGYVVAAGTGEGVALMALKKPATRRLVLEARYRTRSEQTTRNAMLVFGDGSGNERLVKVGTAIGLGAHVIFTGDWASLGGGEKKSASFQPGTTFEATVTVDIPGGKVVAEIDGVKVEAALPQDLKQITHYGIYVKQTTSSFTPVKITRAD